MPTVSSRGNAIVGTPVSTTWANTANAWDGAVGTTPATYATWTNAARSTVGSITVGGYFGASSIPSGSVITACSIALRHLESSATVISSVTAQLQDSTGANIGTAQTVALSTAAATATITPSALPTLAQVNAGLRLLITITRGNNTTSSVFSLDYADITVTYNTPTVIQPPAAAIGFSGGTPGISAPVSLKPSSAAMGFAGGTPGISAPVTVRPPAAAVGFAGGVPLIAAPVTLRPLGAHLGFTGGTPIIRINPKVIATGGTVVSFGGVVLLIPTT